MRFHYVPERVTAPAALPVSLERVKAHCRVDHSEEDDLLTDLIGAATDHLDGWSGVLRRCLVSQAWSVSFDEFADVMRLPFPALTIESVTSLNAAGDETTASPSGYALRRDTLGSFVERLTSAIWPAVSNERQAVTVTFVAGYGDADDVPKAIQSALLLMIGDLYANRETAVIGLSASAIPMSTTVQRLLRPHSLVKV